MPTTPAEILSTAQADAAAKCHVCGKPVTITDNAILVIARRYGATCDACADAENRQATAQAISTSRQHRLDEWARVCPLDFQGTEPHRLPSLTKLQRVLAWQHRPRGLLLHGPTGTGKSRCAWMLCRREFLAGKTVRALTHEVQFRYAAQFAHGAEAVARWASGLVAADVLLLDDVFKVKLTDSVESALFSIVSSRTERGRPIIATLNDTGASLAARLTEDRGEALVRRLREFAESISFTP